MENNRDKVLAKLAIAEIEQLRIIENIEPFQKLAALGNRYHKEYQGMLISEIPGAVMGRDLFKRIGIDPTKRRPSSEALLRRGLNEKGYFSINLLVDIGNWCSLEFLLPICVYDADSIQGKLRGRTGKPGEGYIAIDTKYLDLNGRYLICDDKGALGSPIKDSLRTRITGTTHSAVLLIYAPDYVENEQLLEYLQIFVERVQKYCGGNLKRKYLAVTEI